MLIMNYLIKIIILLLLSFSNANAKNISENKILFKISNEVYTNIDLEKRIKYIEILNNITFSDLNEKNQNELIDDYISSLIFYEYYKKNNISYKNINKETEDLFIKKIKKNIISNKKEISYFKNNLKKDLIRKKIIEDILNSRKSLLNTKSSNQDLIYNYDISYIITELTKVKIDDINKIKNRNDFTKYKDYLIKNSISFINKNQNIIDSNKLPKFINNNATNSTKILILNQNKYITIVSIEKDLESYDDIFVKLINFKSKKKLSYEELNCKNIIKKISKTEFKEYEYSKLNQKIKDNLKSINDFIMIDDKDFFNYIFLCELIYDEDKLLAINFDKKVNLLVKKIQNNFLNKFKKKFNFTQINE